MKASSSRTRGFTLLEVMIGLAILGLSLTMLIKRASYSMGAAKEAEMIGVVTDLSRGKMYDIEEILLKDGFTDSDQSEEGKDFKEEGWPNIKYSYKVEQVELPSWESLQAMATERATGSGDGSGSAFGASAFQNSALGGMMSQLGGLGGGGGSAGIDAMQGASFIQGQYTMVQEVLKVSIRKVTLTVNYEGANGPDSMVTVAYFTDPNAMDKVLSGLGAQDLDDQPQAGSGSGSGRGTNPSRPGRGSGGTTPPRPRPPRGGGR